ncbi:MAG: hypothetical protein Q9210_005294, partial [Variospora velana]
MVKERLCVLLIGNGGREHALAWKLSQSPRLEKLYITPGNGGTGQIPRAENVPYLKPDMFLDLQVFARKFRVDLVIMGPEAPLVAGIEETFRSAGIPFFGPSKMAAQMEKGVILPVSKDQAQDALKEMMVDKAFGSAGNEVVIEEFLTGQELSFLSFVDGYTIKSLVPAQDHKQVYDNDQGPNTGGMGCYAPTPIADKGLIEEVHRKILQPTIAGMRTEHMPFKGLLFTGIMVTSSGPKTLEYNTRFGDPETQTLLPLMESDLIEVMLACTDGYLDTIDVACKSGFSSVTVVACSGGYPGSYTTGEPITIDSGASSNTDANTHIFHSGTSLASGTLKTAGGRVIAATAVAPTLQGAVANAYSTLSTISFPGIHYRRDIAHRALSPSTSSSLPVAQSSSAPKTSGFTYASSGVSITNGNKFVSAIKPLVATTRISGSIATIGSFGGPFDLHLAGYPNGPRLVSGMDGVGTKIRIAQRMKKHDTIGIDLVAMCVNDILCEGAKPFQFMDTYSCNKLDVNIATEVVKGVVMGCKEAGCALVGGETAEMGDIYREGEYDLIGSATGAIGYGMASLPRKSDMREGDVVLGLASSGCHSNGFSLVQKMVEKSGLEYTDPAPWAAKLTIGAALLTPTRIYVKPLLAAIEKVKGAAHITGGGLLENVPRCLPRNLAAELDF